MDLSLTGSLEERDLKVSRDEDGHSYPDEVENLDIYGADKLAIIETAPLCLDAIRDELSEGRRRSYDVGAFES